MLNFIYIVQSKWYLRLKISVQGPFKLLTYILDSHYWQQISSFVDCCDENPQLDVGKTKEIINDYWF